LKRWNAALGGLLLAATLLIPLSGAVASPLIDPFLEKFRVGFFTDPDKIPQTAGWLTDLFAPSSLDPAWAEVAARFLDSSRPGVPGGLRAALLEPALGSAAAARVWEQDHRLRIERLLDGGDPEQGAFSRLPGFRFLLKEILGQSALKSHEEMDYRAGLETVSALLSYRTAPRLSSEEILVWASAARGAGDPGPGGSLPGRLALAAGPRPL